MAMRLLFNVAQHDIIGKGFLGADCVAVASDDIACVDVEDFIDLVPSETQVIHALSCSASAIK